MWRRLRWSALAVVVAVGARTAWRLHESAELVRLSRPLQRAPVQPSLRLLIVGDSTAVGTGATAPQSSVAGLLGPAFPHLRIDNRAQDGATFATVLAQLDAAERFDMVLVMAGGNVGNAPFFLAPWSWLMTWRARRLHAIVREAAVRHGAVFVDLFREAADDPFVLQPALNAADGLHPSDAGYRLWFGELMEQADLPQRLAGGA